MCVCKKVKRASVVDGIQGAPCDAIPWSGGLASLGWRATTYVNKGANKNSKVGIILTARLSFSLLMSFSLFFGTSCRDKLRNGPIGMYGTDMNNGLVCRKKVWSGKVER